MNSLERGKNMRTTSLSLLLLLALSPAGCPSSEVEDSDVFTDGTLCKPACEGRECGPDGCGGKCGECLPDSGVACSEEGKCESVFRLEPDARVFELAIPDAEPQKVCQALEQQYADLLAQAGGCDSVLDCSHVVEHRMPCSCTQYISDASFEGKLAAVVSEYKKRSCDEGETCGACPFLMLPQCGEGHCGAMMPLCGDLEATYQQALLEARQCQTVDECSAQVLSGPGCQCMTPVDGEAWTGFFELAAEYWQTSQCPASDCLCVEGEVTCTDGMCGIGGGQPAEGSKECIGGDECEAISGCACGCWSEPPNPAPQECPCAAPQACVCYHGMCDQPDEGSQYCQGDSDCKPVGDCLCDCYSMEPVHETGPDLPQCDCGPPEACFCQEHKCVGVW
jgi:hypothetical protein